MTAPESTPPQGDGDTADQNAADQNVPPVAPAYSTPPPEANETAESN